MYFAVALAGTVAGAIDHWAIAGAPAWVKPAEFTLSSAIHAGTLNWLPSFVPGTGACWSPRRGAPW